MKNLRITSKMHLLIGAAIAVVLLTAQIQESPAAELGFVTATGDTVAANDASKSNHKPVVWSAQHPGATARVVHTRSGRLELVVSG